MSVDQKYRVLVVDDEAAVLLTYRLILERQGYEVVACGTSKAAIQAMEQPKACSGPYHYIPDNGKAYKEKK